MNERKQTIDLVQLKIRENNNIAKCIKLIKNFDYSLSVGTIKKQI